jgi:hypothetical protein
MKEVHIIKIDKKNKKKYYKTYKRSLNSTPLHIAAQGSCP